MAKILGLMQAKNSAETIGQCIRSQSFCDKIIVFDDHSRDETVRIARDHGADVLSSPWLDDYRNYVLGKNREYLLVEAAAYDPEWICFLDTDEVWEVKAWEKISPLLSDDELQVIEARVFHFWNDANTVRVDGHFGHAHRQRIWRFQSGPLTYRSMHESLPTELKKGKWADPNIALWHYHYLTPEKRRRAYEQCMKIDFFRTDLDLDRNYSADIQGDFGGPDVSLNLTGEPFRLESLDDFMARTEGTFSLPVK